MRVVLANLRSEVMPPPGLPTQPSIYTRNGAASIEFALRTPLDVALISQPRTSDEEYFSCRLQNQVALARFITADDFDAGPKVDVAGPGGKSLEARNDGVPILYLDLLDAPAPKPGPSELPPPFFSEGTWMLSGPGGRSLASFQADLTLPPPVRLTNRPQLSTIERSRNQVVSWLADGYTDRDVMTVILTGWVSPVPALGGIAANGVMCHAPASAGQVIIPADLLQRIPALPGGSSIPAGTLEVRLNSHPYRRELWPYR